VNNKDKVGDIKKMMIEKMEFVNLQNIFSVLELTPDGKEYPLDDTENVLDLVNEWIDKETGIVQNKFLFVFKEGTKHDLRQQMSKNLTQPGYTKQKLRVLAEGKKARTKVVAIFDYNGQAEEDLPLKKEDVVTILGKPYQEWWKGELNGRVGVFPCNYVKLISNPADQELDMLIDQLNEFEDQRLTILHQQHQKNGFNYSSRF